MPRSIALVVEVDRFRRATPDESLDLLDQLANSFRVSTPTIQAAARAISQSSRQGHQPIQPTGAHVASTFPSGSVRRRPARNAGPRD